MAVTKLFGRWGKQTILHYCWVTPVASSPQTAAKLRRPELCTVIPLGLEELELLMATVKRLESMHEGSRNDRSSSALQDLRSLERFQSSEGSDKEDECP